MDDTEKPPSPRRLTAFALATLGLETVRRGTIRAMLPKGVRKRRGPVAIERWHLGDRTGIVKNKTSMAFGQALKELESHGWLERAAEVVVVRDRQALLAYAMEYEPAVTRDMLNVKGAITAARDDLRRVRGTANRDQLAQRHDEIRTLLYLLHAPTAGPQTARRSTFTSI
ncbi:hypothetical protein AB0D14_02040 [Streptomyces sp. NPDC048484]|uniref:hypothetical protein n=1 Tax=Streptomyces sp. NPDC048484 TaxID=3155146 RepID=UPI00342BA5C5